MSGSPPEVPLADWISGELGDISHHAAEILEQLQAAEKRIDPDQCVSLAAVGAGQRGQAGYAERTFRAGDEIAAIWELGGHLPWLALGLTERPDEDYFAALFGINYALVEATSLNEGIHECSAVPCHLRAVRAVLEMTTETLSPGGRTYRLAHGEVTP